MKGHNNGTGINYAIAYFHGRIEQQIETFADRISISPMELAARLATLLSNTGAGASNSLSVLSLATGAGRSGVSTLESVIEPHSSETQTARGSKTRETTSDKISKAAKKRWVNMPESKKKALLKKMHDARFPKGTVKKKKTKEQLAKQKIYVARSTARKKGLSIPPLPSERNVA